MNAEIQIAIATALEKYPNTIGQCASFSAYLSDQLLRLQVENYVALGSLSCKDVKIFQYSGPFPRRPMKSNLINWSGHAWINLTKENLILDATIIRSARSRSQGDITRQHFESLEIIDKGAIVCSLNEAKTKLDLKYTEKSILHPGCFEYLIHGLNLINQSQ